MNLRPVSEERTAGYALELKGKRLVLTVKNPDLNNPLVFHFTSGLTYDFTVDNITTGKKWRSSADKMYAAVLWDLTLGPGEKKVYEEEVDGQILEGQVEIKAYYLGDKQPRLPVGEIRVEGSSR